MYIRIFTCLRRSKEEYINIVCGMVFEAGILFSVICCTPLPVLLLYDSPGGVVIARVIIWGKLTHVKLRRCKSQKKIMVQNKS